MNKDIPQDNLTLKFGTIKAWEFHSFDDNPALREAIDFYNDNVENSPACGTQDRSGKHNEALCMIIDAVNTDEIYLDWDGEYIQRKPRRNT